MLLDGVSLRGVSIDGNHRFCSRTREASLWRIIRELWISLVIVVVGSKRFSGW